LPDLVDAAKDDEDEEEELEQSTTPGFQDTHQENLVVTPEVKETTPESQDTRQEDLAATPDVEGTVPESQGVGEEAPAVAPEVVETAPGSQNRQDDPPTPDEDNDSNSGSDSVDNSETTTLAYDAVQKVFPPEMEYCRKHLQVGSGLGAQYARLVLALIAFERAHQFQASQI
jgi:hypothetical protein